MLELQQHLPPDASQDDRRIVLSYLVELSITVGKVDDAVKNNTTLRAFGLQYHDDLAIALALYHQTRMLQIEGKQEDAIAAIKQTLYIAGRVNDKKLTFRSNMLAGTIYENIGDFQTALQHLFIAMNALDGDDHETLSKRSTALYLISNLYLDLKDPHLALDYNAKALELAVRYHNLRIIAALANSRGDAYANMGEKSEATKAYTEALSASQKASDPVEEATALGSLAGLALEQGHFTTCADYAQRAKNILQKIQYKIPLANAELTLGLCHINLGATALGNDEVERSLGIMRQAGLKPNLEAALGQIVDAYTKAGMFREAVKTLQEQRTLSAEMFQADRDRAVSELQAKFDASERQKQISLLEQQNRLQNEEIKIKNLQRAFGALLLIMIVVIGIILLRSKEKLRKLAIRQNLDKSKFMADAAHDLRQPLQAIGNLLEAAKHANAREDKVKAQALIHLTQSATQIMRKSFDSVLEISRLESGLMEADYVSFNLIELINDICIPLMPTAAEHGVQLRTRFKAEKNMFAHSDRHLLQRVIDNLLTNAIKYADPAKGQYRCVIISVISLPDRYRIDIIDNGIGIPHNEQKNIFRPFYQIHNLEHDREKGQGLGLSIVQSIFLLLEDHRIRMRSTEGKGTRFSISVPRAPGLTPIQTQQLTSVNTMAADLSGLYVLLVEDDLLVRMSTEALFQEYGILYETAKSFEALTKKLSTLERMPDLILTDFSLSENYSASDVLKAAYAEFERHIPTIVLTGKSDNFDAVRKNISAHILFKPADPNALLNKIRQLCLTAQN
ncbi:ATP-binding protein [Undibacterium sp. RuTC16W]|uniref:ATP-binding protein n=1 Tax=Undibacterium sp. RuTC16W TaxID=3413048 RepID=UPI003BF20D86